MRGVICFFVIYLCEKTHRHGLSFFLLCVKLMLNQVLMLSKERKKKRILLPRRSSSYKLIFTSSKSDIDYVIVLGELNVSQDINKISVAKRYISISFPL